MAMQYIVILFIILVQSAFLSHESLAAEQRTPSVARHYLPNSHITPEMWREVKPYLLPPNHPIKAKLDKLFSKARITTDRETVIKAGFKYPSEHGLNVHALKHPDVEGYFIKVYLDKKEHPEEWKKYILRIEGAELIRKAIKKHGYEKFMKVPHKWIYPLPGEPSPLPEYEDRRKNFVLIAEDMETYNSNKNHERWYSRATVRHLRALYKMVETYGLRDSCRVANVPWGRDKKIAFVDTEQHHRWPVNYHTLNKYLSPEFRKHWTKITHKENETRR